jgi:hypothetical protein
MHLFFECGFSQTFWWALGMEWNLDLSIHEMNKYAIDRYYYEFLMEIMIICCWST